MKFKRILTQSIQTLVLAASTIQFVYATEVTVIGTLEQSLKQTTNITAKKDIQDEKIIQLLHVQLSEGEKERLARHVQNVSTHSQQFAQTDLSLASSPFPAQVKLGMNNVPVLDQGMHGTCVTFAITAALDAAIAKGDYISQLCNLQLGSYLEKHGYGVSGWNGSYTNQVINQMEQFGIVNTEKQRKIGCGGMTQYPTYTAHNPESFIEPDKYRAISEFIFGQQVNWYDVLQENDPIKTLDNVKQALHEGDRLVFAVLLPRTDLGFVGAVGKYKTWIYKDSWVLTPEILKGVNDVDAAHEMVITGYDDNAVAVDNHGVKHKGLLFLRNSWGSAYGDYGEFYMSYDYFKLLAYDVMRFAPTTR